MQDNQLKGEWLQMRGKVKEQWGKLTNDDLDIIAGKRDQLIGRLHERYGEGLEEVERQVKGFEASRGL
jgi:uncharacterized protein YjbJ (UPF0337 family)